MIHYIDGQLWNWSAWVARRSDGGTGFPSQVSFARLSGGEKRSMMPVIDEDAAAVELCVLRLGDVHWRVVQACYLGPERNMTQVALICRCHRDTVYTRLHEAHVQIMGWMNDIAAGMTLPPARIRKHLSPTPLTGNPTLTYDLCHE